MAYGCGVIPILGGPGAGKGTQGLLLSQFLAVPHISSGDLVRQHIATSVGTATGDAVGLGELLPDEDAARLVFARLEQPDAAGGVVLDGFPRTIEQVHLLDDWLGSRGGEVPVRASGRRWPEQAYGCSSSNAKRNFAIEFGERECSHGVRRRRGNLGFTGR